MVNKNKDFLLHPTEVSWMFSSAALLGQYLVSDITTFSPDEDILCINTLDKMLSVL